MKKAFFLSDLHLGAAHAGNPKETEKTVVRFLDYIKEEAGELYLLGDILDYWFEYKYSVPKGNVRFFGKLAELSDSGVKITWLIGNHDIWIFDYLPDELGIDIVDGILEKEVLGKPFCMQHGDGIGGSRKFRFMRMLFRNKVCQKLYSGIHPRWTVGFAFYCSRKSRATQQLNGYRPHDLIDGIRQWCEIRIREGDVSKYFIFGHLHSLYDEKLPDNRRLIVLPAFPECLKYGMFDGETMVIKEFEE